MITEKKRRGIAPTLLIANGSPSGVVTLADTKNFFVKQKVILTSSTKPAISLEVKRILSPTQLMVGPIGPSMVTYQNLSGFNVADGASISAPEQDRPSISEKDFNRAKYAEEPIIAERSILVDEYGRYYNKENPFPISAVIEADVNVDLDGLSKDDPDSVMITGSDDGTPTGNKKPVRVDSDSDLRVGISNGNKKVTITEDRTSTVFSLDTVSKNTLLSKPFDQITVLAKNLNGDPITIQTYIQSTPVQIMVITYDDDGDFVEAAVSDV